MVMKEQVEALRQQQIIKTGLYTRYLLLRYSLAIFFFANLNWALANIVSGSWSAILPIILVIAAIPAAYEQMTLYSAPSSHLTYTKNYFKLQMFMQIISGAICLSSFFKTLFPLFTTYWQTRATLGVLLAIGMGIILLNLRRIAEIERNVDPFYQKFQHMYSTD